MVRIDKRLGTWRVIWLGKGHRCKTGLQTYQEALEWTKNHWEQIQNHPYDLSRQIMEKDIKSLRT